MLSIFGRFNERGGGGGGGGGCLRAKKKKKKKKKSQYRLTVAVSEKFSARLKTKGSSHTIEKIFFFLGIAGPPLCRRARGSVPPYPPPPPPLNGTAYA